MQTLIALTRDVTQPQSYCTFGTLAVGSGLVQTIERPWVPGPAGSVCGMQGKSCIPKGIYKLDPRHTEAKGDHWILSNPELGVYRYENEIPAGVYARCLVLIHVANWAHELLGCIAPGMARAEMEGEWGVTKSNVAMGGLRALLHDVDDLHLAII